MDAFVGPIHDCACGFYKFTGKHIGYVRHLEVNINSLKEEMEKLDEIKIDIEERVRSTEYNNLQPLAQVGGWLQRVEQWKREVDVLILQGQAEIQQKCFFGSCPKNIFVSYKVAKKVSLELTKVVNLKDDGKFELVTSMLPRATLNEMPLGNTVGLDEKVKQVWNSLMDPMKKIIGIYGMGGIGKTTLMKRINNKLARETHDFGMVIWIVASKDLNIDMLQNDIGKKLVVYDDDKWRQKNRIDKASDIFNFLKEKRFLLLLDDLWQGLDLEEVGIPPFSAEENNNTKILFTTRKEDVCRSMRASALIRIDSLQWEESWTLFKSKVGEENLDSHPQIRELAVEVAKHCGGLPLSLITVGRTMASKRTRHEWEHAITTLKSACSKFSSMEENVLLTLKFSYDNLPDEIIKQCFLYCSLFPEDHEIYYSTELIPLWIGEGFFDEYDAISDAENLGHDIIGRLKLACLLENENYGDDYVKMHDVIRDMAFWIATDYGKNKNKILVGNHRMDKVPGTARWKEAQRISFERCEIKEVDVTPDCSNLSTLRICRNTNLVKISDTFFQLMTSLKVLDLSWNRRLRKLPRSLFQLSSSLQFLNLSYTGIEEMPVELKNLGKLKYLRLRGIHKLKVPLNVISSLSMLVRLDLYDTGSSSSSNGALLDELEGLSDLQSTGLTVGSEIALQKFLSSEKLQGVTRELYIKGILGLRSLELSLLLRNKSLRVVGIRDCNDLEEVIAFNQSSEKEQIGGLDFSPCFSNLRWLTIANNRTLKNLECIGNIPSLESLYIFYCPALEEIIQGDHKVDDAFSGLKDLRLWNLPKLRSICKNSLHFPLLETINVRNCPKLKRLPLDEVAKSPNMDKLRYIVGESDWLKKLIWDEESTPSLLSPYFQDHQVRVAS